MTEREKLIKLLKEKQDYGVVLKENQMDDRYNYTKEISNVSVADYLLENGISILPCKIGDTLYYHDYKCGAFNDDKAEWNIIDSIVCEIRIKKKGTLAEMSSGRIFTHKDFGKIIFHTKEEAEKALTERNNT